MDDLVNNFLESFFTEELKTQLYKALGIFTVFGLTNIHQELPNIILQEGEEHREVIIDKVINLITGGLDNLLFLQRITLSEDASLSFKNEFLEAIFAFNAREDYTPYQLIVEDWTTKNEEKLALIIADILNKESCYILEHLEWVYDGTISKLTEYIAMKVSIEEKAEDIPQLRLIRKNLKVYEASFGTPASVQGLLDVNMTMGGPFQIYLDLFHDAIIDLTDLEATTFNLIWLALISKEGMDNPQKLLLENSDTLFTDIQQQQIFTKMLQKAMGHFQEFKGMGQ